MPFKSEEQRKTYQKVYYEKKKLSATNNVTMVESLVVEVKEEELRQALIKEVEDPTLLILHIKRYHTVLVTATSIAKHKTQVRDYYNQVLIDYKERAIDYFKYKHIRNSLTVGNKYISLIKNEENPTNKTHLFFILKEKVRDGIRVLSFGSDKEEELLIGNEELNLIEQYKEQKLIHLLHPPITQSHNEEQQEAQTYPLYPTINLSHNEEEKLIEQTRHKEYIKSLLSTITINTELINMKTSPPSCWKVLEILPNHIHIEQYKVLSGRDTRGLNVFACFFDESFRVRVYLSYDRINNLQIYDASKRYTDNKPNVRMFKETAKELIRKTPPMIYA
jgi:hypothetical protein